MKKSKKPPTPIITKVIFDEAVDRFHEAETRFSRSIILMKEKDFSGSVEASQHCLELAIKSLFILVGLEPPRTHDPGKQLDKVVTRIEELTKKQISLIDRVPFQRLKYLSHHFERLHIEGMYGYENIPPSKIFEQTDADYYIQNCFDAIFGIRLVQLVLGYIFNYISEEERHALMALLRMGSSVE